MVIQVAKNQMHQIHVLSSPCSKRELNDDLCPFSLSLFWECLLGDVSEWEREYPFSDSSLSMYFRI